MGYPMNVFFRLGDQSVSAPEVLQMAVTQEGARRGHAIWTHSAPKAEVA